jgi:hypothetical protein
MQLLGESKVMALGCYPAVTPALELVELALQTLRQKWRSSAGRMISKRLCAREIWW